MGLLQPLIIQPVSLIDFVPFPFSGSQVGNWKVLLENPITKARTGLQIPFSQSWRPTHDQVRHSRRGDHDENMTTTEKVDSRREIEQRKLNTLHALNSCPTSPRHEGRFEDM